MGFPKINEKELENFKIISGHKLHNNCFHIIIELPSNRKYPLDIAKKDKRYLMGIIWTFPFELQLELLKLIINNKVRNNAKLQYIKKVQELLNELNPFEQNFGQSVSISEEEYERLMI